MLRVLIVILAVFLIIGMLPTWPYSTNWGYYPSGGAFLIAVVLLFFMLSNRRGDIV